jgi:serine/threonine-protein kinase
VSRGLAQYRLLQRLAQGGQGEVFLAIDRRLNRRVCIKLYAYEGGLREARRVQREAWRLARIDSPRVVDVIDVVAHGGRLALVTAWIPGCTLTRLLAARGVLRPEDALALISDLASALAALRRSQLVHGDLASDNVLVDRDGRAFLVDFGAAVLGGDRPVAVSPWAASPEHLRGDPIDLRSDFFALGLLLYRMLLARHPFVREGHVDRALLLRGLRSVPNLEALPDAVRPGVEALLLSLLASDPRRRPVGTFELREQLRQLRAELPAPVPIRLPPDDSDMAGPSSAVLPAGLRRLPWYRQVLSALEHYWSRGSIGARALLIVALLLPVTALGIVAADPGPCIAVPMPEYGSGARNLLAVPPPQAFHSLLTEWVSDAAGRALVLGAGPANDSRLSLRIQGFRDVCVPQRRMTVALACNDSVCRLVIHARRELATRRRDVELSPTVPQQEFRAAVLPLLRQQTAWLVR